MKRKPPVSVLDVYALVFVCLWLVLMTILYLFRKDLYEGYLPMENHSCCSSCGIEFSEHLGVVGLCSELERMKRDYVD